MNKIIPHDSFCRDILADVTTFLEFIDYLASIHAYLKGIIDLLDMDTLVRIPGDFSDTASTGYADLAFRANVKKEYLQEGNPVQVCVGFLLEHKSYRDDNVMEQLRKYHYHMMVEKLKNNASKGIPSVAIILYNGNETWNPLDSELKRFPEILRDIVLPFKCIFLDVDDIADETSLHKFSPRLCLFIIAMKYARNPEAHSDIFKNALDRLGEKPYSQETLDLLTSIDVYLGSWLSKTFEEVFKMDFIRPPYETIADVQRKRVEAAEQRLAEIEADIASKDADLAAKDADLAAKDADLAAKDAEIASLKAQIAALTGK
ncbi:MAG: Rpn family recombination-promoting nuclease/putative transposase [Fibrobacter sp.]|nr:Rpn family recombination-promoting nuclease/putative transposase [Fibrobacter sp.]